jgi:hypothetical protein
LEKKGDKKRGDGGDQAADQRGGERDHQKPREKKRAGDEGDLGFLRPPREEGKQSPPSSRSSPVYFLLPLLNVCITCNIVSNSQVLP